MKFILALIAALAVFGSSNAIDIPNVGHGALAREIQDFLDIIPVDDIIYKTLEYVAEDPEVQMAIAYMQSAEFQILAQDVENMYEIKKLMAYIYDAGIDIYQIVNMFNDFIGLGPVVPYKNVRPAIIGGIRGLLDEIKALLDVPRLNALYEKKVRESQVFADFINQIKSPEFQSIVDAVFAHPHFQNLLEKARTAGVDLQAIREILEIIFGITIPDYA